METHNIFFFKKMLTLVFLLSCFVNNVQLIGTAHIDWFYLTIKDIHMGFNIFF